MKDKSERKKNSKKLKNECETRTLKKKAHKIRLVRESYAQMKAVCGKFSTGRKGNTKLNL